MNKTYDASDQQARLTQMVMLGELRLRRLSLDQVIASGTLLVDPLTDESLPAWFQKGWDHYLFDLPYSSVRSAVDLFKRIEP